MGGEMGCSQHSQTMFGSNSGEASLLVTGSKTVQEQGLAPQAVRRETWKRGVIKPEGGSRKLLLPLEHCCQKEEWVPFYLLPQAVGTAVSRWRWRSQVTKTRCPYKFDTGLSVVRSTTFCTGFSVAALTLKVGPEAALV